MGRGKRGQCIGRRDDRWLPVRSWGDILLWDRDRPEPNAFIAKFSLDGKEIWSRIWGGKYYDTAQSLTYQGTSLYVTGLTFSYGNNTPDWGNTFLARFTTDGTEVWNRTYSYGIGTHTVSNSISSNGNMLYIAGEISGSFFSEAFLLKVNFDGAKQWLVHWGGSYHDAAYAVHATDDHIYICGWTGSFGTGTPDKPNAFLVAYDNFGLVIWEQIWGGTGLDTAWGLTVNDSTIIIIGDTMSYSPSPNNLSNVFVVKYRKDGTFLQQGIYGGQNDVMTRDIVVKGDTILVTGGIRKDTSSKYDVLVLSIDATTAKEEKRVLWGGSQDDFGFGIASDGNISYVVGSTSSFGPGVPDEPNAFIVGFSSDLLPDLVIVDITINEVDSSGASDRNYMIKVQVSNLGMKTPNLQTTLELQIDRKKVSETNVTPLAQNRSMLAAFNWDGPAKGTHTITAIVDPNDLVQESNETNNIKTIYFEVTPKPIIDISNIQLDLAVSVVILVIMALLVFIVIRRKREKITKGKEKND